MDEKIKEFWDICHVENRVESLSGSKYLETIDFLKINHLIQPRIKVLEVGTGFGHVVKGLYDEGVLVSCLEISKMGIEKVRKYCENTYGLEDLDKIPSDYFDVIICINVVQHIPTVVLKKELWHCLRSLKSSGVFAIEFVSNDEIEDMGSNPNLDQIENGVCCRSLEFLGNLVESFGGTCELVFTKNVDINVVKGQHVFHIKKQLRSS
jgi:SAM-dependent methyltransferase